jgi:sialate O-acetylesterase
MIIIIFIKNNVMKNLWLLIMVVLMGSSCNKGLNEDFNLSCLVSDGMVIQQNSACPVWGEATPGTEIKIVAGWGDEYTAQADDQGRWSINLNSPQAGGPYDIDIRYADTLINIKDVVAGEVWLASGQSNMEMPVEGWGDEFVEFSDQSIAEASQFDVRMFTVDKAKSTEPLMNCSGQWEPANPDNVREFSATAYFFARKLNTELDVPVGIIHSSWGGTPAEAWTSPEYLSEVPAYKDRVKELEKIAGQTEQLTSWLDSLEQAKMPNSPKGWKKVLPRNENVYSKAKTSSDWPVIELPAKWEEAEMGNFDGAIWFTKTFKIENSGISSGAMIHLGPIDDMDQVYINGVLIGETLVDGKYNVNRNYSIPGGVLNQGENLIAIRVIDTRGGGGFTGYPEDMYLNYGNDKLSIDGEWHYKPCAEIYNGLVYLYEDMEHDFAKRPDVTFTFNSHTPSALYNAMINPVIPYRIKGAIWYQGESNVERAFEYKTLFPTMIRSWRDKWEMGDFPFYYVQIAPWNYKESVPSKAAELREAQAQAMKEPNTGMVVTMDIGDPVTIHPPKKKDVGERLARWALHHEYNLDVPFSGPVFDKLELTKDTAFVYFKYTEGGLHVTGDEVVNMEIVDSQMQWHPAQVNVRGDYLSVYNNDVKNPQAVRYGWRDTASINLFNTAGLPAAPFRTDEWDWLTQE